MSKNIVSIIVPVYNVEKYIERCLDSLINQTYSNIEIILVNDGSTDDSEIICNEYEKKDKRIKVLNKKNGGLSSARNAGLKIINGNYVMFVDSDDFVDLSIVETLLNNITETKSDISICSYYSIKGDNKSSPIFNNTKFIVNDNKKYYNLYNEYSGVTVSSCMKLFKSTLFNNIHFTEGAIHEDEIIIFELLKLAKKISYDLEPLYYYENRTGSITRKFDITKLKLIEFLNQRIDFFRMMNKNDLIQMTDYKILYTYTSLICDYYNYKNNYSDLNSIKAIRKNIKRKSIKCIFYKSLSIKSRINSLMLFLLPLKVYSRIIKLR